MSRIKSRVKSKFFSFWTLKKMCVTKLLGVVLVALTTAAYAQSKISSNAANEWMKNPSTQDRPSDTVSPSIRHERNLFFEKGIGSAFPLTANSASSLHVAKGSHYLTGNPEIPQISNRTTIIGTFTDFKSVLTPSHLAIYTEVTFSVDYVFESTDNEISARSIITVILPGGSVKTEDGRTISYLVDPEEYFIQPHKRYLLILTYNSHGDFYSLEKDWDLSSGTVKPNSRSEQARADEGRSSLVGLNEEKLIPVLQAELANSR